MGETPLHEESDPHRFRLATIVARIVIQIEYRCCSCRGYARPVIAHHNPSDVVTFEDRHLDVIAEVGCIGGPVAEYLAHQTGSPATANSGSAATTRTLARRDDSRTA